MHLSELCCMTDLNAEGINKEKNCVNAVVSLASLPVVNLFRLIFFTKSRLAPKVINLVCFGGE